MDFLTQKCCDRTQNSTWISILLRKSLQFNFQVNTIGIVFDWNCTTKEPKFICVF